MQYPLASILRAGCTASRAEERFCMNAVDFGLSRPPWHIRRTGFPIAWQMLGTRSGRWRPVHIGMLDSGADLKHPLLAGLLGEGKNLLRPEESPQDENGHGTHVAGIIAEASGCWYQKYKQPVVVLHPVKIFDQTGFGRVGDIVRGMYWCAEHGMDIINLSFGTDRKTSKALRYTVREIEKANILLVAAAGNDGRRGAVDFPGRYPEVLAVSASTKHDRLAPFSSSGPEVDLMAPGSRVISLAPGGGFVRMSGTSMAAPHVSAAAALVLAMEPYLFPAIVRERLTQTAEWLPSLGAQAQGAGMLRADRLLHWSPD